METLMSSQHSAIIQQLRDGSFRGIYCHFDGYPSYSGTILKNHYTTYEAVNELIDLGDIATLGKRVKPRPDESHSYNCPNKEITVAYYRDRNESWDQVSPTKGLSFKAVREKIDGKYTYLFTAGEWYLYENKLDNLTLVKNLNDVK